MSTLIGLKLNDTVVLATDSLLYDNQHRALSRTQQKIHEVSPGVFYGWSGSRSLAIQQANIAGALSRIARPRNLCAFAEELNKASMPCIVQQANRSLAQQVQPPVSEEPPLFIYILAGVSEGVPGFLVCEFRLLKNGEVARETASYFESNTCGSYITGDKSLIPIINNPKSWEGGLIKATERFVDHLRLVQPTYVNGPIQMACIDKSGARWIHEPVELHREGTVDGGSGGVQARLLSGSPLSVDTSANLIIKQGAGVGTDGSGNFIVKTSATIGTDVSGNIIIPALAVQTANLAAGSLGDLSKYSSTVRAVTITFGLPSLPNSAYPAGAMVMNTSDGKVYRTATGYASSWTTSTSPADLFTGTLASGVVYAGTVAAANVTAGSLYGFTITGSTMQLNLYGVTTMLGNIYDSGVSAYVGIKVSDNSSAGYSSMSSHGVWQTDNAGNTGKLANGILALQAAGGSFITVSPFFLQMSGLPSYNPGTGTKQFWYDTSDGNRVKFAA